MFAGRRTMAGQAGMRKCNDRGFTLLEVLIGLLIFSIGALASGMMIAASLQQNVKAKDRTVLAGLVEERLEEIRGRNWDTGMTTLASGGQILSDEDLEGFTLGTLDSAFSESFNLELTSAADDGYQTPYYMVMWRIEDLTDNGQALKRVTVRGVSMHWAPGASQWEPVTTFDNVAIIFRETKTS